MDHQFHLGNCPTTCCATCMSAASIPRCRSADDRVAPPRRGAGTDQASGHRHESQARPGAHRQSGRGAPAKPPARTFTTPPSSRCGTCVSRASQQQLKADFEAYLDGFSPNVQDILDKFEFLNQIPRLSKADALGTLIEKFLDPSVNLSPYQVKTADGSIKNPGLDNHAMGTIFEELVRRFNEENNEEAGEHWTPRDAVKLMARLVLLPIADQVEVRDLPPLRRRLRHGRHAHRRGRDAA